MPAAKKKPAKDDTAALSAEEILTELGGEWVEVEGESYGITVDPTDGPIVGVYKGSEEVETTDPDGNARDSVVHRFTSLDPDRPPFSVWESHDLKGKLTDELIGKAVFIEHVETIPIKAGRQQLKLFRVRSRDIG